MDSTFTHVEVDPNLPCTTAQLDKLVGSRAYSEAQLANGVVHRYIAGTTLFCTPDDALLAGGIAQWWARQL